MNKQTLKEFCYTQLKMTNNPLFLSFKWNVCRNERHLKQNSSAGSSTNSFDFFLSFMTLLFWQQCLNFQAIMVMSDVLGRIMFHMPLISGFCYIYSEVRAKKVWLSPPVTLVALFFRYIARLSLFVFPFKIGHLKFSNIHFTACQ